MIYEMIQGAIKLLQNLELRFTPVRNVFKPEAAVEKLDRLMLASPDGEAAFPKAGFEFIEMGVAYLCDLSHVLACRAGWWDGRDVNRPLDFGACIALIHSEVSEALEGGRKGLDDAHLPHRPSVEVEFADAIIRICDTACAMQLDLGGAILEKLAYNVTRADHSREARAAAGGKKL